MLKHVETGAFRYVPNVGVSIRIPIFDRMARMVTIHPLPLLDT